MPNTKPTSNSRVETKNQIKSHIFSAHTVTQEEAVMIQNVHASPEKWIE